MVLALCRGQMVGGEDGYSGRLGGARIAARGAVYHVALGIFVISAQPQKTNGPQTTPTCLGLMFTSFLEGRLATCVAARTGRRRGLVGGSR